MSFGEETENNFYDVLGLKKDCSATELRNAYKKLAMRWHPDRCSSCESSEEAKKKFQDIQEAYSVLSDDKKRFMYDVGFYDDSEDVGGMSDFIGEMVDLINQNSNQEAQQEGDKHSIEELQNLFDAIFTDENATSSSSWKSKEPLVENFCQSTSTFQMESFSANGFCLGTGDSRGRKTKHGCKRRR